MEQSKSRKTFSQEVKGTVSEIIKQVKKLIKEGNARRVIIKDKDDKVLFESQLIIGVGGAALLTSIAPIISAISMFVMFLNDVKIIVERYPGEGEKDDYEVEADFIEIRDADESEEKEKRTDKTVGKENSEEE